MTGDAQIVKRQSRCSAHNDDVLRNRRGNISFGTALAMALVVLGVGFLFLSLFMGGQKEAKNAIDAGALSVGKQVLDADQVSVELSGDPNQQIFSDCTSDQIDPNSAGNPVQPGGKITLRRINRVWAKALTIAINAAAAGSDANTGTSNAQQACSGAQEISDSLAAKLTNPSNLYSFFDDFAQRNSVRMLGTSANVQELPGSNWQTSLMDRNVESNIVLPGNPGNNFNMPANYTLPSNFYTQSTRPNVPAAGANLWFLKGYTPLTVGGQTFWQVPFQYDEKPHLVSKTTFDAAQPSAQPLDWTNAVPNAFSVEGKALPKQGVGEKGMSWVLTNPREPFTLSIPQSFLHIHVDTMQAYFYFFPAGFPIKDPLQPEVDYGYTPSTATGAPMLQGGPFCSSVTPDEVELGLEVVGQPLDGIIFGLIPPADTTDLETNMVNRINEMVGQAGSPKSASDLHALLSNPYTTACLIKGDQDFYIYSTDGINLTVQPQEIAQTVPWLSNMISNDPDGNETEPVDDATSPSPIFFTPIVTPDPDCAPVFPPIGTATYNKDIHWTPGSGYNGNLGLVRVTRYTNVYSLGVCSPV